MSVVGKSYFVGQDQACAVGVGNCHGGRKERGCVRRTSRSIHKNQPDEDAAADVTRTAALRGECMNTGVS